LQQFFRKHFSTLILLLLAGIVLFSPNAKAFVLKALLGTGVLNARTEKEQREDSSAARMGLVFTDAKGDTFNTAALRGKVVFINFWATWCPPCIAEMGSINALYNKLKTDPRIVFIMADADSNLPAAASFMQKHQYDLPVYRVAGALPANLFTGTLPTTLIIDANGKLVQKHGGIANYDTPAMLDFLKGL
jgi:thiol-disulfide isomerase/thioredoxin